MIDLLCEMGANLQLRRRPPSAWCNIIMAPGSRATVYRKWLIVKFNFWLYSWTIGNYTGGFSVRLDRALSYRLRNSTNISSVLLFMIHDFVPYFYSSRNQAIFFRVILLPQPDSSLFYNVIFSDLKKLVWVTTKFSIRLVLLFGQGRRQFDVRGENSTAENVQSI